MSAFFRDRTITLTTTKTTGWLWWKRTVPVSRTYLGSGTVWRDLETGHRADVDTETQLSATAWLAALNEEW